MAQALQNATNAKDDTNAQDGNCVKEAKEDVQADVQLVCFLSYNGANFNGFARQKDLSLRTVQGELDSALSTVIARPVLSVCAGRTDAGVHALGQVASWPITKTEAQMYTLSKFQISLNAITGDDIAVHDMKFAAANFSPRFDVISRTYTYRIVQGFKPPLFLQDFCWWNRGFLDIDAMRVASKYLIGEHDFKSFCRAMSAKDKNTVRKILNIDIFTENQLGEECICIQITGTAFLHSMVRSIVGTLVQVGRGNKPPEWVAEVLASCDRRAAGENAPAKGLVFTSVKYPQEIFKENLQEVLS